MAAAALWLSSTPAQAAILHESGDGYHIIEYSAGRGEAGSVILLVEILANGRSSNKFQVRLTVLEVLTNPGYSYRVKKGTAVNSSVEVQFSDGDCQAKFKAMYKPGRTVVNGGKLKCKTR